MTFDIVHNPFQINKWFIICRFTADIILISYAPYYIKQISQETDFSIIQEDGSCSEDVLEYLCSRNSQMETYDLFDQINVDLEPSAYDQWVNHTFTDSLEAEQLQQLFSQKL